MNREGLYQADDVQIEEGEYENFVNCTNQRQVEKSFTG